MYWNRSLQSQRGDQLLWLCFLQLLRLAHLASCSTVFWIRFTCSCNGSRLGMMYAGKCPSVSRRVGATLIFISVCKRLHLSSLLCVRFVSFGMSSCSLPWFIAPAFLTSLPAGYQPAFDHACTRAGWFYVYRTCSNRLRMDAGVVFIPHISPSLPPLRHRGNRLYPTTLLPHRRIPSSLRLAH